MCPQLYALSANAHRRLAELLHFLVEADKGARKRLVLNMSGGDESGDAGPSVHFDLNFRLSRLD